MIIPAMIKKTFISTGRAEFDELYPRVKAFLEKDKLDLFIDGRRSGVIELLMRVPCGFATTAI